MSILTDIRTAAQTYADDNITASFGTFVPDVPGTWNPDEQASFTITGRNAGAPDGIAVINVRYHLRASGLTEDGEGVRLVVPAETVAIARAESADTSRQLTPGDLVNDMFLFPITPDGIALGIGDGDTIFGLKAQAGSKAGVGELTLDVHAELDYEAIFPVGRINDRVSVPINIV